MLRCPSCHTPIRSRGRRCPRCQAETGRWLRWQQAGWRDHFQQYVVRNPFSWLAVISLFLPLVVSGLIDSPSGGYLYMVLLVSLVLSVTGLGVLFLLRDQLWADELVRGERNRNTEMPFQRGLLLWGGLGFTLFALVGLWLLAQLTIATWQTQPLMLDGLLGDLTIFIVGIAFTGMTWSAGLYAVFVYGQWKSRTFPPPIFLNYEALATLVEQEATGRIRVKLRRHRAIVVRMMDLKQSQDGGLTGLMQSEASMDEVADGYYMQSAQLWRVVADRWGNLKILTREGVPSRKPDLARPFTPSSQEAKVAEPSVRVDIGTQTNALALEGEVLLLEDDGPVNVRKGLIYAVMAANLKRKR